MSLPPVCDEQYQRPDGTLLFCTYPRLIAHDTHSWQRVKVADDATRVDYTPQAVQAYLDSITRGEMDAYLEAILAVTHNRKRAQRGVAGFTH